MADVHIQTPLGGDPLDGGGLDCFTCGALDEYNRLAEDYIYALGDVLYNPLVTLFLALVGLWAVITGFKFWLAMVSPMHVIRDVVAIIVAYSLLSAQGGTLVANIYTASLDFMTGAAITAFSIGPGVPDGGGGAGIVGLMRTTEAGVAGVFSGAADVISSSSRWNPMPYVFAAALVIPYFYVVVLFFSKIVVSIFRLMILGILAPFLIIFFAFGWGRDMAISGIRTLVSAVFVLFAASISVGLLLYGVDNLVTDLTREEISGEGLLSSRYLTVMMLGWLGAALMTEGIGIANSITGSLLSNTAAAVIAGGVSATAGWVARTAWSQGGGEALKGLLPGGSAPGGGLAPSPGQSLPHSSDAGGGPDRTFRILGFTIGRDGGRSGP